MADVTKQTVKKDYIAAVGRRREARARVRLYDHVKPDMVWDKTEIKKNEMYVNAKPIAEYFGGDVSRHLYTEPFRVAGAQNKYTITIRVEGGGPAGQLDAAVLGISRALSKIDEKYHTLLKKKGFMTRDARIRERRKVGMGGKARRKRQSPKR